MTFRIVETQTNDVIVTVNKTGLHKFIGWCEAHRTALESEPSWLGRVLNDLELATEGYALDARAECAACGADYPLLTAEEHLSRDGEWYCKDRDACTKRCTVTCAGCGAQSHCMSSDVAYDPDAGGWFCTHPVDCSQRRAAVTA